MVRVSPHMAFAAAAALVLAAGPARAVVPIPGWGYIVTQSHTTYVLTGSIVEPAGTQGASGTVAITVLPSVHSIVIDGGGFTIDGRDTAGPADLDVGIDLRGIESGKVRDVVIRDVRFTDVSTGIRGRDYLCNILVEDCEFAGCVNLGAIEFATTLDGAVMSWVTVRDNWLHDGEGMPIRFANGANAGAGEATMEHVAVVANVIHGYRRSAGYAADWNGGIAFQDGAAVVRVWDNIVLGGDRESGVFVGSGDALDAPYDDVSIRGNTLAGATGNMHPPGSVIASGVTLDRVTTTAGNFSTWVVARNVLAQNQGAGIHLLVGSNSPPSLPTAGNWWGQDGTTGGTYGNGAINATDSAPLDLPDGILARPDRQGGLDRALTDVGGFAGMAVILNQMNGPPGIRGFDVDYDFATSLDFERAVLGPFLARQASQIQFYDIPRIGGTGNERTASGAILGGGAPLAVGNGVVYLAVLRGDAEDKTTPDDFFLDAAALRDPGNFPVAVAALDGADRPVDDTPPAAVLTAPGGNPCVGTENASIGVALTDNLALEDVYYRFYRSDKAAGCWIPLSLDEAGDTYTGPALVPVVFDHGEFTYVFELCATDDAGNVANPQLILTFDETPPADFAGTTSAVAVPGPGTPAVEEVRFTWSGTFEAGGDLRLRYLPYGGSVGNYAYPEYDDAAPVPGPHFPGPAEGTEVDLPDVGAGAIVVPFTIAQRSYYYFTLYVRDCAGNPSPGAAPGVRRTALSYYLGDWDSHAPPACPGSPEYTSGNGEVNFCDLIGLSRAFATTPGDPDWSPYTDIGPTTPGPGVLDRPATDNVIDFEDLILFGINFGNVSPLGGGGDGEAEVAGGVALDLEVVGRTADRLTLALRVSGAVGALAGLEAVIDAGGLQLIEARPGPPLPDRHFLHAMEKGARVTLSLALLGAEARFAAPGRVAELDLRLDPASPAPAFRLVSAKLRDRANRDIGGAAEPAAVRGTTVAGPPAEFALGEPAPNPFNPATTIRFTVPVRTAVTVAVYDPAGRLVERLHDGAAEPGEHALTWNARGERSGVYLVEMNAGGFRAVRKLLLVK